MQGTRRVSGSSDQVGRMVQGRWLGLPVYIRKSRAPNIHTFIYIRFGYYTSHVFLHILMAIEYSRNLHNPTLINVISLPYILQLEVISLNKCCTLFFISSQTHALDLFSLAIFIFLHLILFFNYEVKVGYVVRYTKI